MSKSIYRGGKILTNYVISEAFGTAELFDEELPVLNSHNFKEGQEVVEGKDYEKKYLIKPGGQLSWIDVEKIAHDIYSNEQRKRIVALPLHLSVQKEKANFKIINYRYAGASEQLYYVAKTAQDMMLPYLVERLSDGVMFSYKGKIGDEIILGFSGDLTDMKAVTSKGEISLLESHPSPAPTPQGKDISAMQEGKCKATFKGEIRKDTFLVLLEFIDDMKLRGWEYVKHDREDLSNGNIRIEYVLIQTQNNKP